MDKLQKKLGESTELDSKPVPRHALPALHSRVKQAESSSNSTAEFPNRIAILADISGSMAEREGKDKPKIELLQNAIDEYIRCCDFTNTALAFYTFPEESKLPLTNDPAILTMATAGLTARGGTPMGEAMQSAILNNALTAAVLISDGDATDGDNSYESSANYAEMSVPIDCVHIGNSSRGEERLAEIARRTGGKYIKFSDVENFAKNFKMLTPRYRALLESKEAAEILGADEVK